MTAAIEIRGLTKAYGTKRALDSIDLTVAEGSATAIVGQTGAGKTSLVSLLLRFYDPQKGSIAVDGQDLRHQRTPRAWRQSSAVIGIDPSTSSSA